MAASFCRSAMHDALYTVLAVLVQSFMLLQVGLLYLRLLWREHGKPSRLQSAGSNPVRSRSRSRSRSPSPAPAAGKEARDFSRCVLSCVMMVRNEEANIRPTLRALADAVAQPELLEVVLVDSGCTDGTVAAARAEARSLPFPLTVCAAAAKGRGAALDTGSESAQGGIIFVCHADCVVPPRFDAAIREAMARPGVLATAFRFAINRAELAGETLPGASVMERTVHVRSTLLQLPFGDQGLALPAATLVALGGWGGRTYPLLEDFQLVQALRREGASVGGGRIEVLDPAATGGQSLQCSPRRWRKLGVWRVNLVNQLVMLWFQRGATPQQLFDFYYGIRTDHVPGWLLTLTAPLMRKA